MKTFYLWPDRMIAAYEDGKRICHPRTWYAGRELPSNCNTSVTELLNEVRESSEARFVIFDKLPPNSPTRGHRVTKARYMEAVREKRTIET